jgi:hypothetical protein
MEVKIYNPRNIQLKEGFRQVCIWPAFALKKRSPEDFEKYMLKKYGLVAQFLEIISTGPDRSESGRAVRDTGGREDLFFAVKEETINVKFQDLRTKEGIWWLEDALLPYFQNKKTTIWPVRVYDYQCR